MANKTKKVRDFSNVKLATRRPKILMGMDKALGEIETLLTSHETINQEFKETFHSTSGEFVKQRGFASELNGAKHLYDLEKIDVKYFDDRYESMNTLYEEVVNGNGTLGFEVEMRNSLGSTLEEIPRSLENENENNYVGLEALGLLKSPIKKMRMLVWGNEEPIEKNQNKFLNLRGRRGVNNFLKQSELFGFHRYYLVESNLCRHIIPDDIDDDIIYSETPILKPEFHEKLKGHDIDYYRVRLDYVLETSISPHTQERALEEIKFMDEFGVSPAYINSDHFVRENVLPLLREEMGRLSTFPYLDDKDDV